VFAFSGGGGALANAVNGGADQYVAHYTETKPFHGLGDNVNKSSSTVTYKIYWDKVSGDVRMEETEGQDTVITIIRGDTQWVWTVKNGGGYDNFMAGCNEGRTDEDRPSDADLITDDESGALASQVAGLTPSLASETDTSRTYSMRDAAGAEIYSYTESIESGNPTHVSSADGHEITFHSLTTAPLPSFIFDIHPQCTDEAARDAAYVKQAEANAMRRLAETGSRELWGMPGMRYCGPGVEGPGGPTTHADAACNYHDWGCWSNCKGAYASASYCFGPHNWKAEHCTCATGLKASSSSWWWAWMDMAVSAAANIFPCWFETHWHRYCGWFPWWHCWWDSPGVHCRAAGNWTSQYWYWNWNAYSWHSTMGC
jgi:hypothetical protein